MGRFLSLSSIEHDHINVSPRVLCCNSRLVLVPKSVVDSLQWGVLTIQAQFLSPQLLIKESEAGPAKSLCVRVEMKHRHPLNIKRNFKQL